MKTKTTKNSEALEESPDNHRREFLKYSAIGAGVLFSSILFPGCKRDQPELPDPNKGVDLGSGDIGVLNYAYALEQLEAAFYTQIIATPYSGMSSEEGKIMEDLRRHEVAHRDFLKAAIGSSAIPDLEVDFSSVDFTDRASVLATAKAVEDLGVSAYNGAGRLLQDVNLLLVAGKIVSVEARHAAAIRDLINPNSIDFAGNDVVNAMGLDVVRTPSQVLAIASTFVKTPINAANLPKT